MPMLVSLIRSHIVVRIGHPILEQVTREIYPALNRKPLAGHSASSPGPKLKYFPCVDGVSKSPPSTITTMGRNCPAFNSQEGNKRQTKNVDMFNLREPVRRPRERSELEILRPGLASSLQTPLSKVQAEGKALQNTKCQQPKS